MSFFKYVAKNEHNETLRGKVEAKTKNIAASVLANRGLLVISITALNQGSFSFITSLFSGIKEDDVANITRQLSTMITAGLPLSSALSILAEQSRPEIAVLVNDVLRSVEGGVAFSAALEKKPKVFSKVYTQLVKAGEAGGVLDEILARLADNMEKEKEFRGKVKGAMIYPVVVLSAMLIVGFVMMTVVVPKLTSMYQDFGADLPALTQGLINLSGFFAKYWWLMLGVFFVASFLFANWKKTKVGDKVVDKFLFKIPVFGKLRKKIILTEFARTMSLLLGAGVSLINAIRIVAEAVESINYRLSLEKVASQVEKGIAMSASMSVDESFPPILHQMISVGEETGKLDEVLLKLSVYFETESAQAVKNMTTALEPAIMVVLGLGVGLLVVAIIMPIYSLTSQF